jgi:hypothetical protein
LLTCRYYREHSAFHESSTEMSSPPSPMRPERLCVLAQRIADSIPDFFETNGPGKGDHVTAEIVRLVREAGGCSIGEGILFNR